jgi:dCTP deaminase
MILSNRDIIECLDQGLFNIDPLAGKDPTKAPFNTSAVDLRLANQIQIPQGNPVALDLRKQGIAAFLAKISQKITITEDQPYTLKPTDFVLAQTLEKVDFSRAAGNLCFSARVEGKSSLARCGILVHFTAPTIHAGWSGPITLEIANLGKMNFLLYPGMYICQLIVEQVLHPPVEAPNQFKGQINPVGEVPEAAKK